MTECVVGTETGVVRATTDDSGWRVAERSLDGYEVKGIIAREGVVLAGTTRGVFRSDDGGCTWHPASEGLNIGHVRWMAYHPDVSDLEFVGVEPAGIFVSTDGAATWTGRPEVEVLRDRFNWFLPYSPEAGCVRGFAFHGHRVYAAVEVGGVLRSDDRGRTWRLAEGSTGEPVFDIPPVPLVHADVHSVASHPSSPDLVFAATAEGLYRSEDGGTTWTVSHLDSYCRAVWVDPQDANHLLLGPANSVSSMHGRIEQSFDGGVTWQSASDGLDLPWPNSMVERFLTLGSEVCAITDGGKVYVTGLPDIRWRRILADALGVRAIAFL